MSSTEKLYRGFGLACALLVVNLPASAAQFQFTTLVQLGEVGNAAPNGWEVGWGPTTTPAVLGSLPTYWANGASREFQVIYDRPTNNMQIRVYDNGSATSYAFGNYTPLGGPSVVGSTWVLPASSFFVTALAGGNVASSITVSGLSLSSPTGAALSVLSPFSSTTLTTNTGPALPTKTVSLSQNVVFQGDATGSWRLSGFVTMNFAGLTGSNYNRLQFGLSALSDVPEPATWAMMALGLALVGFGTHRRR
jgi:PEP-CTERM motif